MTLRPESERIRQLEAEVARLQGLLGLRTAAGAAPAAPESAPAKPAKPLRILVADDHPAQAKITLSLLATLGYTADLVRNGQEVLYALEKKQYDVALMDVQMPVLNGFETTAAIRERYPTGKRPRIVALTGRNLERDRSDCLAAGMDDFIGKPIALRILEAKLAGRAEALVDKKVFADLAEATGKDTIKDVVEMFLRDTPRAMRDMRAAAAAGDAPTLRGIAHPQVSVCHALGVLPMSLLARQIETAASEGRTDSAPALLDDFEALLAPAEVELHELLGGGAAVEPPPAGVASAPRILVVEDNPVNKRIALSLLESMGHHADAADTGRAAIQALEQQRYDLVLMDILLPVMDGLAATREICRRWPKERRPRIVGMTGLTADADRQAGIEAGMDDYIAKPLTGQVLTATLARFGIGARTPITQGAAARVATATVIPPPESVLLDEAVLRQWAESKREAALGLIDDFVKDLRVMLAELRRASDSGDAGMFRRAAHSLKSASMRVGAMEMATLAAELEAKGRKGAMDGVKVAADRLIALREPLTDKLEELRRQLAG